LRVVEIGFEIEQTAALPADQGVPVVHEELRTRPLGNGVVRSHQQPADRHDLPGEFAGRIVRSIDILDE
jgi:hypothetical protein